MVETTTEPATATDHPGSRRQAWERATDLPMMGLAVVFLGVYAWRVLNTSAAPWLTTLLNWVDIVIWALFAVDLVVRIWLSTDRWRFLRTHPIDVLVVVVPPFRPLRLLRAALVLLGSLNRATHTRTRMATFVGASSAMVILLCSLAFFDAERRAEGSSVENFGDALWWSLVSATTVGYGDIYPVTVEGRIVAAILMTLGIGLISFAIGTATSWVVEQVEAADTKAQRTDAQLVTLLDEIRELRTELAELRGSPRPPDRPESPTEVG